MIKKILLLCSMSIGLTQAAIMRRVLFLNSTPDSLRVTTRDAKNQKLSFDIAPNLPEQKRLQANWKTTFLQGAKKWFSNENIFLKSLVIQDRKKTGNENNIDVTNLNRFLNTNPVPKEGEGLLTFKIEKLDSGVYTVTPLPNYKLVSEK